MYKASGVQGHRRDFLRIQDPLRHKGPAFRTSRIDAVADAAWQAITSWVHSNKSRLQNSVHYLLPYRKKDQFKANKGYPPLSDTEDEKMYRDADEVESFGAEAPVLAGRLRALLEHLGITTAPRYRIKEVPRLGQVEFKAVTEIFFGSRVLCRHMGPAFKASHSDAVVYATWQAITSWVRSNKS
jgi:hypothetical protein